MKFTLVPAQIERADAEMETLTCTIGLTVIIILLDKAGFPDAQFALEINKQETWSPFDGKCEKVPVVAPEIFHPLTLHWNWGAEPPFTGVAIKLTIVPVQTTAVEVEIVTLTG